MKSREREIFMNKNGNSNNKCLLCRAWQGECGVDFSLLLLHSVRKIPCYFAFEEWKWKCVAFAMSWAWAVYVVACTWEHWIPPLRMTYDRSRGFECFSSFFSWEGSLEVAMKIPISIRSHVNPSRRKAESIGDCVWGSSRGGSKQTQMVCWFNISLLRIAHT